MSRLLKLELINGNNSTTLGELKSGEVRVGREPGGNGIAVDADGVSRVHGSFVRFRNHWLYRDTGSTNGSWVNGVKLQPEHFALVRHGSVVQLADVGIRVLEFADAAEPQSLKNFPGLGGRSVLVFESGSFLEEYPIPEYGKALVIGGATCDLEIDGDMADAPSLVIERRADTVVVYGVANDFPLLLNGKPVDGTQSLTDNDYLNLAKYYILFNDPGAAAVNVEGQVSITTTVRGWEDDESSATAGFSKEVQSSGSKVFGSSIYDASDMDGSDSPFTGAGSGSGRHKTTALNMNPENSKSYASLEEKIILYIGLLVVVAVLLLLIWWLIQ